MRNRSYRHDKSLCLIAIALLVLLTIVGCHPIAEEVEFDSVCLSPLNKKLIQLDSNSYSICRDENTAKVRIELTKESKEKLPDTLLEKTKVVVKANNKEYKTNYKNGGFECNIELLEEETQYYAECDCSGYFKLVTPITKIVKGDCEPETPQMVKENPVIENPVIEFGDCSIEELRREPIGMKIFDLNSQKELDPNKFNFDIEVENSFLYEDPHLSIKGDTISLDIRLKGEWCECLLPEYLNFKVISTPKEDVVFDEGQQFVQTIIPFRVKLVKERSWFSRCLWVLLTIAGLLLLMFFLLRALIKKNRLKKDTADTLDLNSNETEEKEEVEEEQQPQEQEEEEKKGEDRCGTSTLD